MKVAFYTLGCKVNQYDSQAMAGYLQRAGHTIVPFDGPADAYVINSCTVTAESDRKTRQAIGKAKKHNPDALVCVAGCYAQHAGPALLQRGDVDAVLGTGHRQRIVEVLESARHGQKLDAVEPYRALAPYEEGQGALIERAIDDASRALLEKDPALARQAIGQGARVDEKEKQIERRCLRLLLQQQPVAADLRMISTALKMITDMERIGDQASDISDITMHIRFENLRSKVHISDMAAAAIKMVTDSIDSFVKKDLELAKAVAAYDDVVDRLFIKVKDELLILIKDGDVSCLDLLMIAKYLERIGDHAVNIAEWVQYSITGQKLL